MGFHGFFTNLTLRWILFFDEKYVFSLNIYENFRPLIFKSYKNLPVLELDHSRVHSYKVKHVEHNCIVKFDKKKKKVHQKLGLLVVGIDQSRYLQSDLEKAF
jgi:hypothetical protein